MYVDIQAQGMYSSPGHQKSQDEVWLPVSVSHALTLCQLLQQQHGMLPITI